MKSGRGVRAGGAVRGTSDRADASAMRRGARAAAYVLVSAAALVAGCTAPSVYDAAAGFRRSTCDRIVEADRRADCLSRADTDAATYERERQRATERR